MLPLFTTHSEKYEFPSATLIGGLGRFLEALQLMERRIVSAGGMPVFRCPDRSFEGNK
jgi:hypothetical protein